MTHDTPAEAPADHKGAAGGQEAEHVEVKTFDPTTYKGPIQTAGSNSVSWGGRTTFQEPRPDGSRYAQNQWQFTMSGAVGQEAPHAAYFAMSGDQQTAFDAPGKLPFNFLSQTGGGPSIPTEQRVIEIEASSSPPAPPAAAPPSCSQCGSNSSSIKKIRTHGGLMRSLCNNCVYDMAGGDQEAFGKMWADGRP